MTYLWFKAFHIIAMVAWFGGLFYLPRLFVYHVEANEQPEPARSILKNQYALMEKRLYGIIMNPGMMLTIGMAIAMLVVQPDLLKQGWLHIKIALATLLLGYHLYCKRLMRMLEAGTCQWTSKQLRAFNEVPTLLLAVIVLLVIFKDGLPWDVTSIGVVITTILFAVAIQLYARKRRLDAEKAATSVSQ
ncbi:MAG: protoporphyrinogen oxidase HemJ [Pseudanabaenaceae cyanobacterium SKYGB_i_bin29]|nr:protoporphyrinogen oxidase HemJ [Pseudanabaenaceae cyanobacterium SKYG29]MDW8421417.1 protoporphyrinogen oxidase HemJ [Pseudanabaenaceae cyanobacterium SKYGB_i_bin29]